MTGARTFVAIAVASVVFAAPPLTAQVPDTEIFLIPVTARDAGPSFGEPRNITNRPGYDNQPAFAPDGQSILYTSIGDDGQADIYRFDISSGVVTRVTATAPESEYSATIIPGQSAISVVRVERDSTQRLWRFPLGDGEPSVILPDVRPVGYYAWADSATLYTFVLGDPPTLQRASPGGPGRIIEDSIGRSIQPIPGGGVSVVLKRAPDEWWIAQVDPATDSIVPLARTRPGQEDYAWMPDGSLLQAEGATLYRWTRGGEWIPVATFAQPALARLTRLAVSADGRWLAVVATSPPPQR